MARINIASLQAQLAAANTTIIEQGRMLEALRLEVAKLTPVQRPLPLRPQRAPRELPPHFIAARELAMRTGTCVKVG